MPTLGVNEVLVVHPGGASELQTWGKERFTDGSVNDLFSGTELFTVTGMFYDHDSKAFYGGCAGLLGEVWKFASRAVRGLSSTAVRHRRLNRTGK